MKNVMVFKMLEKAFWTVYEVVSILEWERKDNLLKDK